MHHGRSTDYAAPFTDVPWESDEAAISRVVSIGIKELGQWWDRIKGDTNPDTYGSTRHEFTSSVAFIASGGEVTKVFADESAPRFEAVRQLGAVINWV